MAGPPLNEATLREAALNYLARYAATATGVRRMLERRIQRWLRTAEDPESAMSEAEAARHRIGPIVERLVETGVINDAAFADTRARGLSQAGRSRRAITARLIGKGVDPATAQASLPDDPDTELAAALVLARRRRIGPFRAGPPDDTAQREMAILARGGFPRDVAQRALAMELDEAETLIRRLRQG
jgi:regulatory protein